MIRQASYYSYCSISFVLRNYKKKTQIRNSVFFLAFGNLINTGIHLYADALFSDSYKAPTGFVVKHTDFNSSFKKLYAKPSNFSLSFLGFSANEIHTQASAYKPASLDVLFNGEANLLETYRLYCETICNRYCSLILSCVGINKT